MCRYVSDVDQEVLPLTAASTASEFPKCPRPPAKLTDEDISQFGKHPLAPFLDQVTLRTRAQQGSAEVSPVLPISLDRHPCAVSHIADTMLRRFTDDCDLFAAEINASKSWRLTSLFDDRIPQLGKDRAGATAAAKQVRGILALLRQHKDRDMEFVRDAIPTLLECANLVPEKQGLDQIK